MTAAVFDECQMISDLYRVKCCMDRAGSTHIAECSFRSCVGGFHMSQIDLYKIVVTLLPFQSSLI